MNNTQNNLSFDDLFNQVQVEDKNNSQQNLNNTVQQSAQIRQEKPDIFKEEFEKTKEEKETTFGDIKNSVKEFGKEFGVEGLSELIATPKNVADFIDFGSNWLAQKGLEEKIKKGEKINPEDVKFTQSVLDILGFPKRALDYVKYPSTEQVSETIREFGKSKGYDLEKPKEPTLAQQRGETIGQFAGGAAFGGPRKLIQRMIMGSIAGAGAQTGKELELGKGGELGLAFALPVMLQLGSQIKSGKFTPSTKELQQLKDFGRNVLGLTEEEITPLLQTEKKIASLGKIAKPTEKVLEQLAGAETKLGKGYEKLRAEAIKLPPADGREVNKLLDSFEKTSEKLKLSDFPSTEKVQVIDKIEKAAEKISKEGITAAGVIESYQDINKTVDWHKVRGGKKELAEIQKSYKEILQNIDPKVAHDFNKINELYSKFKNIESAINSNQYKNFVDYGKYAAFLGVVGKSAMSGDITTIAQSTGVYLGYELSRKFATKLLTDPKYQNILIKSTNAVKNGSRAAGVRSFNEFAEQLSKDFPDDAKKVDWKDMAKDAILNRK